MNISEFTCLLHLYSDAELQFVMPEGRIAAHSHVTEVGRIEKLFIDCGGKPRRTSFCNVQMWEHTDYEHRLLPSKLAAIFGKAAPIFGGEDISVEIEFEHDVISQYPIKEGKFIDGKLVFELEKKHTACLAIELCAPSKDSKECTAGSGCCG